MGWWLVSGFGHGWALLVFLLHHCFPLQSVLQYRTLGKTGDTLGGSTTAALSNRQFRYVDLPDTWIVVLVSKYPTLIITLIIISSTRPASQPYLIRGASLTLSFPLHHLVLLSDASHVICFWWFFIISGRLYWRICDGADAEAGGGLLLVGDGDWGHHDEVLVWEGHLDVH